MKNLFGVFKYEHQDNLAKKANIINEGLQTDYAVGFYTGQMRAFGLFFTVACLSCLVSDIIAGLMLDSIIAFIGAIIGIIGIAVSYKSQNQREEKLKSGTYWLTDYVEIFTELCDFENKEHNTGWITKGEPTKQGVYAVEIKDVGIRIAFWFKDHGWNFPHESGYTGNGKILRFMGVDPDILCCSVAALEDGFHED